MASPLQKTIAAEFSRALKLQNAKKPDEAELVYMAVLSADPIHPDAHHNLGLIKLERGHPGIALPYLQYSVHLRPETPETHNTLANAWRELGKTKEAEASYRRATTLNPKYALAWFNLANMLSDAQRSADAEKAYRSAIAAKPDYAQAYLNLGNVLRSQARREEALALLKKLVEVAPKYELAHNNLGNIYRDLDMLPEAASSYRRAVEINQHYALGWLNLGTVLNHLGQREDSLEALRRAIAVAPRFGEPYMQLATMMKPALDDPIVDAMKYYFDEPATLARDRMYLAFGLGRVFDENGQYDRAFNYFREGNRLKRATLNFDIAGERNLNARMRARFSKDILQKAPVSTVSDETPIFIVGMMRSGSTLMEQILASHPDVEGADELQWIPEIASSFKPPSGLRYPDWISSATREDLTRLGQAYIERVRGRFGNQPRFITDKLPGNFLFIGLIHLILPKAKIIHMRRNPYDTCLSIYGMLFANQHHYSYDQRELGEFYRLYGEMMKHWDEVLPGKVFHQRYEDLVAEPEQSVRRVLAHCGLSFNAKCLEFYNTQRRVKTASSQQVREELHSRSIERWRNYEKHLGEWRAIFGDAR